MTPVSDLANLRAIADQVWTDLDSRWSRGEQPCLDEYLEQSPELRGSSLVAELALLEFRHRRRAGQ